MFDQLEDGILQDSLSVMTVFVNKVLLKQPHPLAYTWSTTAFVLQGQSCLVTT